MSALASRRKIPGIVRGLYWHRPKENRHALSHSGLALKPDRREPCTGRIRLRLLTIHRPRHSRTCTRSRLRAAVRRESPREQRRILLAQCILSPFRRQQSITRSWRERDFRTWCSDRLAYSPTRPDTDRDCGSRLMPVRRRSGRDSLHRTRTNVALPSISM